MDLADLLECSICLEQLSGHNKVLPCQHTFCTQCLKVGTVYTAPAGVNEWFQQTSCSLSFYVTLSSSDF